MSLTGTTVVDILEMGKLASKVLTCRMFTQSIQFLQIFSGFENGERVFRITYRREFWKIVSMPPEMPTGEKLMLNHVDRCINRTLRGQAQINEQICNFAISDSAMSGSVIPFSFENHNG
jgi:hypothetical protein